VEAAVVSFAAASEGTRQVKSYPVDDSAGEQSAPGRDPPFPGRERRRDHRGSQDARERSACVFVENPARVPGAQSDAARLGLVARGIDERRRCPWPCHRRDRSGEKRVRALRVVRARTHITGQVEDERTWRGPRPPDGRRDSVILAQKSESRVVSAHGALNFFSSDVRRSVPDMAAVRGRVLGRGNLSGRDWSGGICQTVCPGTNLREREPPRGAHPRTLSSAYG